MNRNDLTLLACSFCLTGCLLHSHVENDLTETESTHIPGSSHHAANPDPDVQQPYSESPVARNPPRNSWPVLVGRKIALHGTGHEARVGSNIVTIYFDGQSLPVILPHDKFDPKSVSFEEENGHHKSADHGPLYVEGILQNVHLSASFGQQGGTSRPKALDHWFAVATRVIPLSPHAAVSDTQEPLSEIEKLFGVENRVGGRLPDGDTGEQ